MDLLKLHGTSSTHQQTVLAKAELSCPDYPKSGTQIFKGYSKLMQQEC